MTVLLVNLPMDQKHRTLRWLFWQLQGCVFFFLHYFLIEGGISLTLAKSRWVGHGDDVWFYNDFIVFRIYKLHRPKSSNCSSVMQRRYWSKHTFWSLRSTCWSRVCSSKRYQSQTHDTHAAMPSIPEWFLLESWWINESWVWCLGSTRQTRQKQSLRATEGGHVPRPMGKAPRHGPGRSWKVSNGRMSETTKCFFQSALFLWFGNGCVW